VEIKTVILNRIVDKAINSERRKIMLCNVCGDVVDETFIICRIDEGKHKGKFVYYHEKCAEEDLIKLDIGRTKKGE